MGGAKSNHFKKEPYRKPTCESKSVLEVAALIGERLSEEHEAESVPELARPILMVKDYAGHVHSIKEALQESGMQCHVGTVANDQELPLICRTAGAVQADILLLDLRQFEDRGCNILMEIGREAHLRRIPLVILANSAADSQISKDSDRHNLWRLSRAVDSEQCVTGLRSLLGQIAILKLPPKGNQRDSGPDTRSSRPRVDKAAPAGVGEKIDWEGLTREINE